MVTSSINGHARPSAYCEPESEAAVAVALVILPPSRETAFANVRPEHFHDVQAREGEVPETYPSGV